jgi:hypothetical protein
VNPDVVSAIDDLVPRGVLPNDVAPKLRRVASGGLVSIRGELQALLYAGVLLVAAGAGLLVKENLSRIGPVVVALALGAAAAACLLWTWRRAPAFSWGETPTPDLAFDYVLLLGALLAAADLAFVEVKFTPLGASWPWHLLTVAAFYAVLALRFDSKMLFSLSLTSFAAWRGVHVKFLAGPWSSSLDDRFLVEALACGVGFVVLGRILERARRKPHFEPVAAWSGWILILGGFAYRIGTEDGGVSYSAALFGSGVLLGAYAFEEGRVGLVALGVAGAGWGAGALAFKFIEAAYLGEKSYALAVVLIAAAVLVVILRANRALSDRR